MAFNPMQQQQSPDMLMAMMTDPRSTPQQRMAAMSALNTMRGGANAPQPPQMTGDGTGVSDMDPAFMAAVRQEMMGQGPEEQPEIQQRQAAPEAPENPATAALMSGAADAARVAAMAQGGAVKGYADGEEVEPTTAQRLATAYNEEIDFPDLYEKLKQKVKASNKGIYNFLHGEGSYDAVDKRSYASRNVSPSSKKRIEDKILREITAKRMAGIDPNAELPAIPPGAPGYGGFNGPVENASPEIEMPQVNTPQFNIAPRANFAAAATQVPPPPAIKPNEPDPAAEAMNARKQEESNAYKERMDKLLSDDQPLSAQDKWMALARAGFAAAAGSSPFALQNIGAGLSKGVESLDELRKERAINRMKQATLLQSQRSEELTSEDRARTAGIQQQLADIQSGELDLKKDPNSPDNIEKRDRGEYYRRLGAAAGKEPSTQLSQRLEKLAKIRAIEDPSQRAAALEDYNAAVSPESSTNDLTARRAVITAGEKAGEAFDRSVSEIDLVDPAKKAENARLRKQVVEDAKRSAAEFLGLTAPNAAAAPPPPAGGGPNARPPLNSFGQ